LFALRQDIKESQRISNFLWIPVIWLAVSASKPFTLWIYPSLASAERTEYDYIQGGSTERTFLLVLICAGLIALYKKRHVFAFHFRDNIYLYIFYFYALISIGWSDYQGVSVKRWVKAASNVIMVLVILTEEEPGEAFDHILRRCAIVLIPLSLFFIRYYPQIGIQYTGEGTRMWVGVAGQKNGLGLLCAFMGIYFIWRFIKDWPKLRWLDGFLFLLTLYLLRGSHSATSYVIFVIGIAILALEVWLKSDLKKLNRVVTITFLCLAIVLSIFGQPVSSAFLSAAGRDPSFTGRLPLWTELIRIGSRSAIFGEGYGNFWIAHLGEMWDQFNWRPINGHNGYIDIFLDLGLVGLALLLFLIVHTYRKAIKSIGRNGEFRSLLFVFLIMILLHNFTESSLGKGAHFLWLLFLLSSVVIVKRPTLLDLPSQQE